MAYAMALFSIMLAFFCCFRKFMGKQYFNQSKLPRIDSEVGHSMNFQMLKYKFPEGIFGLFFGNQFRDT